MKSEFLLAITQLSAEKNLPREVVLSAVEAALASAYRKDNFAPGQNVEVKINPNTGQVEVWAEKVVVEHPTDPRAQISLEAARRIKPDVQLEDTIMVEATPPDAKRIAAQTAKQVILQRLHEAEHSAIFEEYAGKEGDLISGIVQRVEPRQVLIDLGRAEAVLPVSEQMPNEHYRVGQRLKVVLLEVVRTPRGPRVIVSRSHPNLVRRLFEMEVPEVFNGAVEIKAIAREAGFRTKVAVAARQEGIDPVGCCVGLRGIRIQNVVSELSGEKIDVVPWDKDVARFIAGALSPAQIVEVILDNEEGVATVVVPDRQLSLAIGKEGQNARLAAKLSGWRVDIKPLSVYEEERAARERAAAEAVAAPAEPVTAEPEAPAVAAAAEAPEETAPAPELAEPEVAEAAEPEEVLEDLLEPEPLAAPDEVEVVEEEPAEEEEEELVEYVELDDSVLFEPPLPETPELRFAEDIIGLQRGPRGKKKGKKSTKKKAKVPPLAKLPEEGVRAKKRRHDEVTIDTDEF